jgi:hypothetical protein
MTVGAREFSLSHNAQTGSEVHSSSYPSGSGDYILGDKQEREADHSPQSSDEVKTDRSTPEHLGMPSWHNK